MHEVERAVIMAAGFGSRLLPITQNTPKPLVSVNGKRMIETGIEGLRSNGISEIRVVVGHLACQFAYLEKKYPGLTLVENPWYDSCNNISSLYCVRNHLENSIIMEGDLIISDDAILSRQFERSSYNCIWSDGPTNEWFLSTEDGIVTSCSKTGGSCGWQLYGISRWTSEDGRKLKDFVEADFVSNKKTSLYWDEIALFEHKADFKLGIIAMPKGCVMEIDSIEELKAVDSSYA